MRCYFKVEMQNVKTFNEIHHDYVFLYSSLNKVQNSLLYFLFENLELKIVRKTSFIWIGHHPSK